MPTFNAKLALSSRSCSEKAPFVVHKITIDYAFDQVFKPKMLSLHENITPQILTFMHELPFFPSHFVWIPFCFCRGIFLVSVVDLFLPWICFCHGFFLFLPWNPFCFCRGYLCFYSFFLFVFVFSSLVPSIISHEIRKTWEFFGKKSIVFLKISIVFWKKSIIFWGLLSNV